jgi:hypothetical protein
MSIHRSVRALAIVCAFAALPGPAWAAKEKKEEAPPKVLRIAILPIVNGSEDLGATKIMEDLIRERLKEVPTSRAIFIHPLETERVLADRNEIGRADRINDRWSKRGTLDSTAVDGLDSLLMVDAILCVKVAEWTNQRVTVVGRGESNTTVGLAFSLFDIATKKELWKKAPHEQRFANEIDPSSSHVAYDETGFIQSRGASDPPRYEDVASDLIRIAFKKFPEK